MFQLDSTIPLSYRPPEMVDPLKAQAQVLALRNAQQQSTLGALQLQQQTELGPLQVQAQRQQIESNQALEEERHQRVALAKRAAEGEAFAGQVFMSAMEPMPDGSIKVNRNMVADAFKPHPEFTNQLPSLFTHLDAMESSFQKVTQARLKAFADIGAAITAGGNTMTAVNIAKTLAVKNNVVREDEIAPYVEQMQADPSQIQSIAKQLIALDPEVQKRYLEQTKALVVPPGSTVFRGGDLGQPVTVPKELTHTQASGWMTKKGDPVTMDQAGNYYGPGLKPLTEGDMVRIPSAALQVYNQTMAAMGQAGDVTAARPDPTVGDKIERTTGLTHNANFQNGLNWVTGSPILTGRVPPQIAAARQAAAQNIGAAVAAQVQRESGYDVPQIRAAYSAYKGSLGQLAKASNANEVFERTALANLALAKTYADKILPATRMAIMGKMSSWIRGQVGDSDITSFQLALYTAMREYAKVTSGAAQSASELSVSAARRAEDVLPVWFNGGQFSDAIKVAATDMTNQQTAYRGVIADAEKNSPALLALFRVTNRGAGIDDKNARFMETPESPSTKTPPPAGEPPAGVARPDGLVIMKAANGNTALLSQADAKKALANGMTVVSGMVK